MHSYQIALLAGDGIGQEVTPQAVRALQAAAKRCGLTLVFREGLIGGTAYQAAGNALPDETVALCHGSAAVLFGSVGGPLLDGLPREKRTGLLELRRSLGLYANLRPARAWAPLAAASPLRPEVISGADILFVRELAGGLYYGPRGEEVRDGTEVAYDTMVYSVPEVERIARVAFDLARGRSRRLCSIDKSNVLASGRLWRRTVSTIAAAYPDVTLEHLLVDNAALQLIRTPARFDVVVAENTFGDILSDELGVLSGSLGMLPSASLGDGGPGLFEPVHGAAPDIAGTGVANPLGSILAGAMLLEYGLNQPGAARLVVAAVELVLSQGWRTRDLAGAGGTVVGTEQMGDLVAAAIAEVEG